MKKLLLLFILTALVSCKKNNSLEPELAKRSNIRMEKPPVAPYVKDLNK